MSHVSASQIAKIFPDGCWRRWFFSRTLGRTPDSPESVFGKDVHDHLERYQLTGEPPNPCTREGACALQALPMIPLPGNALPEREFRIEYQGVPYVGRSDLIWGYSGEGGLICVTDYKTIGDFHNAHNPESLGPDPQRILYAYWVASRLPVQHVIAIWLYLRRSKPQAHPVVLKEDRDGIFARMEDLHRKKGLPIFQAHGMIRSGATADAFPRNLRVCYKYPRRPCEFLERCWADMSPLEKAAAAMAAPTP